MDTISHIIRKKQKEDVGETPHYISQEFQDFGYRLAVDLNDQKHKALYIKLAKEEDRVLLEKARSYVIDYPQAKSKGKLFMWALKKLRKGEPLATPLAKNHPGPK